MFLFVRYYQLCCHLFCYQPAHLLQDEKARVFSLHLLQKPRMEPVLVEQNQP